MTREKRITKRRTPAGANKRLPPAQSKLHKRASEEFDAWNKTLTKAERAKLFPKRSEWAKKGGTIATSLRHGKQARDRERLREERLARLEAERAQFLAEKIDQGDEKC